MVLLVVGSVAVVINGDTTLDVSVFVPFVPVIVVSPVDLPIINNNNNNCT